MRFFAWSSSCPPHRVRHRVELRRATCAPQGDSVTTLVEHPSHREREHPQAIALAARNGRANATAARY